MMSFHDLGHVFHRYGIMSFAGEDAGGGEGDKENKDNGEEESKNTAAAAAHTAPMRRVFENANRGNWPGDGRVSQISLTERYSRCD